MRAIGTIGRAWADTLSSDFCDSYADMRVFSEKVLCRPDEYIYSVKGTYSWHPGMRNEMVAEMEGEWLFQTDTDHIFAPDILTRLLRIMKKERVNVVSGIYQFKAHGSGHGPVAGFWDEEGRFNPMLDWDREAESLDVGAVGGGCLLVKGELFRRMRARFKCEPFDQIGGISEDFSFCKRAVEMGERVVLCLQVQSHHQTKNCLDIRAYPKRTDVKVIQTKGGLILPPHSEVDSSDPSHPQQT